MTSVEVHLDMMNHPAGSFSRLVQSALTDEEDNFGTVVPKNTDVDLGALAFEISDAVPVFSEVDETLESKTLVSPPQYARILRVEIGFTVCFPWHRESDDTEFDLWLLAWWVSMDLSLSENIQALGC